MVFELSLPERVDVARRRAAAGAPTAVFCRPGLRAARLQSPAIRAWSDHEILDALRVCAARPWPHTPLDRLAAGFARHPTATLAQSRFGS
jgi:hypothetical protein